VSRIAADEHPIELDYGDVVIFSSRTIPGNERTVGQIQNRLVDLGCEIVTDGDALVHVTGHPRRDELREMYAAVRPRIAVPMHGEARHLEAHRKLAVTAGVKEVVSLRNGEMVRLAPDAPDIVDQAPVGRQFRDGNLLVPTDEGPVRERRSLAYAGVVIVALARSGRGNVSPDAEIVLDGVPQADAEGRPMAEIVRRTIDGTLASIPRDRQKDTEMVREAIRRAVRAAVDDAWGKRPAVKVLIVQPGK
jgi:ribonuclease J